MSDDPNDSLFVCHSTPHDRVSDLPFQILTPRHVDSIRGLPHCNAFSRSTPVQGNPPDCQQNQEQPCPLQKKRAHCGQDEIHHVILGVSRHVAPSIQHQHNEDHTGDLLV